MRFCPGVHGDICTICCGTGREVTVACPLDCPYLRDAHAHEKPPELDTEAVPNRDIRVSEDLLEENAELLAFLGQSLATAALEAPGTVDFDVRDALDALIRTYRTRQSGLYYDSLPANAVAANLYRRLEEALEQFRKQENERLGVTRTRDSAVLALLVFLQRLELDRNNGRARGRAFIDFLHGLYRDEPGDTGSQSSPLLLP
jgi:hypothetical protein